jgi:hypothetical protein
MNVTKKGLEITTMPGKKIRTDSSKKREREREREKRAIKRAQKTVEKQTWFESAG